MDHDTRIQKIKLSIDSSGPSIIEKMVLDDLIVEIRFQKFNNALQYYISFTSKLKDWNLTDFFTQFNTISTCLEVFIKLYYLETRYIEFDNNNSVLCILEYFMSNELGDYK